MRNLKKLLAVIVAICVIATFTVPAFAADAAPIGADAQICKDLGVLKGDADGVTATYLAKGTTRLQAAILTLRLMGKEAEAYAETSTDTFTDGNIAWKEGKAALAYLKKNPTLGWVGDGKTFNPDGAASAQMIYKVILTALGYKEGTDFQYADTVKFAADKGLTKIAAVTALTNNDAGIALVEGLKANLKDGKTTLAADLVAKNVITKAAAEAAKLVQGAVALDVASAVAINSKVVEVSLDTAATAADVAAATFAVKDSAAKAFAVTKAELAAYDTDNKTLVLALDADTSAGTVYTLTVGTKAVNFGGRPVDTAKPEVDKVESTEYNKVKITFTEPIKLDSAVAVAFTEKYGNKAALTISETKYSGNSALVLTTSDQKADTLYGEVISGVSDFAGNVMDKKDDLTFVGNKKDDSDLKVQLGEGQNNPEEAVIRFNVRVDATTVNKDAFKVEEMYGNKAVIAVTDAKIATDDDAGISNADLAGKLNDANDSARHVIITVPGVKSDTLYKVTATGLKSVYGKALSSTSTDTYTTFVGKKKPTDPYVYTVIGGASVSSTIIKIKATDVKLVKADAENVANYAIAEAYGNKTALTITKAELDGDGKTVKLTTSAMKTVLYKITVSNVKDIYGNAIKTADDANIVSFSGLASASKISKINTIVYDTDSVTVIKVTFDQAVGTSANDVAHYSVDNSVGYVLKAEADSDTPAMVNLTLPKLTTGKTYTLTVKGLENADGVAMDTAGITGTFLGKGNTATKPQITGIIATDKQTLKIFFDRDVTDSAIEGAGKVWINKTGGTAINSLVAGQLILKGKSTFNTTGSKDLAAYTEYAYQDSADTNVLNVRINTADFVAANVKADGTLELDASANSILDGDHDDLAFSPSTTDIANIKLEGFMALNKQTIRLFFNQAVEIEDVANFAKVAITSANKTYGAAERTLSNATAADSTNKVFDIAVSGALASTSNWLIVNPAVTTARIHDKTATSVGQANYLGYVTMDDEETSSTATVEYVREFAGSTGDIGSVSSVSVIMPDARTIELYYNEPMNTSVTGSDAAASASVTDFDNYTITQESAASSTVVSKTINEIKWDAASNKATIKLNVDLGTSTVGTYYMQFNRLMTNAVGLKNVQKSGTDTAAISTQFAKSGTEAPKITVSSAVYDKAVGAGTITIKLSQKAKTRSNVVGSAANFVALFNINGKIANGDNHTAIATDILGVTATLDGATVADTTAGYFDTIVVTLDPASGYTDTFDSNRVGDVTVTDGTHLATDDGLTGVNGMHADKDTKGLFGQN